MEANKRKIVIIATAVTLFVCLCALVILIVANPTPPTAVTDNPAIAAATATETAVILPTDAPTDTPTSIPTDTPTPTAVPTDTATPRPTNTPRPTSTPRPTVTPRPTNTPTPTPAPLLIEGRGDSVIDLDRNGSPAILRFSHRGSGNVFIYNYNAQGDRLDLLVNAVGDYDGAVAFDLFEREHTTRLQITARGSWTLEVDGIASARILTVPGQIEGNGDDVFLLTGQTPDLATVAHNGRRNFFIYSYGQTRRLLVNAIGDYEGQVIVPSDAILVTVSGDGSWRIQVSAKR